MADVEVSCSACGKQVLISEFADLSIMACSVCGGSLNRGQADASAPESGGPAPRLQVVRRGPGEAVNLRGEAIAPKPVFALSEKVIPKTALEEPDADRPARRWLGIVALLAGLAFLVGPQAVSGSMPEVHAVYLNARYGVLAALWLIVVLDAWREGAAQGLLTIFIPPYAFVYAMLRTEYVWLKALVFSAGLMLGAELYFLNDNAMIRQAQASINSGIQAVERSIQRAGDPVPD